MTHIRQGRLRLEKGLPGTVDDKCPTQKLRNVHFIFMESRAQWEKAVKRVLAGMRLSLN